MYLLPPGGQGREQHEALENIKVVFSTGGKKEIDICGVLVCKVHSHSVSHMNLPTTLEVSRAWTVPISQKKLRFRKGKSTES